MKQRIYILIISLFLLFTSLFIYAQMMQDGHHHHYMRHHRNQNGQWVAPPQANRLTNPIVKNSRSISAGKKLFQANCIVCHGDKGRGDGMAGVGLNPRPTDFTSTYSKDESDGALYWKITTGNSPMPSYKQMLNDTERWQLVDYIRELQKTN